jgi:hypothetical protein
MQNFIMYDCKIHPLSWKIYEMSLGEHDLIFKLGWQGGKNIMQCY